MNDLLALIKRFQFLKEITGTNKSSSYSVQLYFDPWSDSVQVEFGGYDIGDWSRHEYMHTTIDNLLVDMENKVKEAETLVSDWSNTDD